MSKYREIQQLVERIFVNRSDVRFQLKSVKDNEVVMDVYSNDIMALNLVLKSIYATLMDEGYRVKECDKETEHNSTKGVEKVVTVVISA